MAPKRATFISWGSDASCVETKKFIEESGVLLTIRDLSKDPLTKDELSFLIGYLDISHFLDRNSKAYADNKLDKSLPPRKEVIEMMANDYTLIRRPIIRSARLITIGCDKKKISQMLQLNSEPEVPREDYNKRGQNARSSNRRRESASHK